MDQPVQTPVPFVPKKFPAASVVIVAVALVLFAAAWVWIGGMSYRPDTVDLYPAETVEGTPIDSVQPYVSETLLPPPDIIDGVNWLGTPNPIKQNLHLFAKGSDEYSKDSYYLLGAINGDQLIISANWDCNIGGCYVYFFRHHGDKYYYLEQDSGLTYRQILNNDGGNGVLLADSVLVDSKSSYIGLRSPQTFTYQGLSFSGGYSGQQSVQIPYVSPTSQMRKLGATADGEFFAIEFPDIGHNIVSPLIFSRFTLKLPSGLYVEYVPKYSMFRDDNTLKATFDDGQRITDPYQNAIRRGCGGNGDATIPAPASERIKRTATTVAGEPLYEFANYNDPVLKVYYSNMTDSDEDGVPEYYNNVPGGGGVLTPITLTQFATKHAVLLYNDPLGRWVVFNRSQFGPQAECGKPVIYLYPTKTTDVSVWVGAKIRISEPEYGNGWTVRAQSDGTLTTADGKQYDSLFWEGLGNGAYPEITQGFVVKQADLETTLRSHLEQLGLNVKESQDFLDFWLAKMPTTPYVRLTWFGTRQMDQLAPLAITPKPDSVIRIFLDFEGLNQSISIAPQHLSAIPRNGFTVVEWGGLLWK